MEFSKSDLMLKVKVWMTPEVNRSTTAQVAEPPHELARTTSPDEETPSFWRLMIVFD